MNPVDFAEAVKHLQWWAAGLLFLLIVIWRSFAYADKRAVARDRAADTKAKASRAEVYAASLDKLANSVSQLSASTEGHVQELRRESNATRAHLAKLDQTVATLANKSAGVMSFDDSVSVYEAFVSHVRREAQYLAEESLKENNYEARAEFVSRKVRTRIAKIIDEVSKRADALGTLSIAPKKVFKTYLNMAAEPVHREVSEQSDDDSNTVVGERYLLCDKLWEAIEPCYRVSYRSGIKQAIEESRTNIDNTVTDYFSHTVNKLKRDYRASVDRVGAAEGNSPSGLYKAKMHPSGEWQA